MAILATNRQALKRRAPTCTGSVLCVVATLSFLVVMTVSISQQHSDMQHARQGLMRARQLAEMGIAVASHPLINPGDLLLRRKVSEVKRFDVILGTKESRLNLNALLTKQHLPENAAFYREVGVTLTIKGPLPAVFRWMHGLLDPTAFRVVSQLKITTDASNPTDVVAVVRVSQLHAPTMVHERSPEAGDA